MCSEFALCANQQSLSPEMQQRILGAICKLAPERPGRSRATWRRTSWSTSAASCSLRVCTCQQGAAQVITIAVLDPSNPGVCLPTTASQHRRRHSSHATVIMANHYWEHRSSCSHCVALQSLPTASVCGITSYACNAWPHTGDRARRHRTTCCVHACTARPPHRR